MMDQRVSIVEGGLLFDLMRRSNLPYQKSKWQVGLLVGFAVWLPMALLAAMEGLAIGGQVRIPLLLDPVPYTRYLLAIPLLFIAEPIFDQAWTETVTYCEHTGLVTKEQHPRFQKAVSEVVAGRNLWLAEIACLGLALLLSFLDSSWGISDRYQFSHWKVPLPEARQLSLAGWWYVSLAEPAYLFLFYRWLWRLFLWARFLWRLSRLDLRLGALHPDRRGGLGFLTVVPLAATMVVVSRSISLAGVFGAKMIFAGAQIADFRGPFFIFLCLALAILLGPLLVFFSTLARLRRTSLLEYSSFATEYTRTFCDKWLAPERPQGEAMLGNSDIQSLADVHSSFESVQQMQPVLWNRQTVFLIVAAVAVPMLPVLLLQYPLREILQIVWNLLS